MPIVVRHTDVEKCLHPKALYSRVISYLFVFRELMNELNKSQFFSLPRLLSSHKPLQASYSVDENLYHTSYESGILEDPMVSPLPEMFKMTVDPIKVSGICCSARLAPCPAVAMGWGN